MSENGSGEWTEEAERKIRRTKTSKSSSLVGAWLGPGKPYTEEAAVARQKEKRWNSRRDAGRKPSAQEGDPEGICLSLPKTEPSANSENE